jgi:hypothetical protein
MPPIKALMRICLYPLGAEKFKPLALRVIVEFSADLLARAY